MPKTALVLGGAACVWSDIEAALDLGEYDLVVACNDVGAAWPGELDAWVSLHGEKFDLWTARRDKAGHPPAKSVIGHAVARDGVLRMPKAITGYAVHRFEGQKEAGSSGHFAMKYAIEDLGVDKAVLCGIPMDPIPHFFDKADWTAWRSHWRGWIEAQPHYKDRARSMSGRTRELLGAPDEEWLSA